jgi:hypothetical protein
MEPNIANDMNDQLADWFNSPDGTYPEIDDFANNFGYTPVKEQVTKQSISKNLEMYVGGGYGSIKNAVSSAEFQFIQDNMKSYGKAMYRVEEKGFTADKLEVGSNFSFKDDIRSFTRSEDYMQNIIGQNVIDEPVIFKTVGATKQFDMTGYADAYYEDQKESLVGGNFKVLTIKEEEIDGIMTKIIRIMQLGK